MRSCPHLNAARKRAAVATGRLEELPRRPGLYRTDGGGGADLPAVDWAAQRRRDIRDAFRDLGEVIYFMRCADGAIKIGWTANLFVRRRRHSIDLTDLLALMPGSYEDEQALHAELVPYRRRGHEYYEPVPAVMDRINKLRASMGVPEIPLPPP